MKKVKKLLGNLTQINSKEFDDKVNKIENDIKRFKVFSLKKLHKLKNENDELRREIKKEKTLKEFLNIKDVMEEFKVSRKTIDRWRVNGLKVIQKSPKSAIRVKRSDVINYLKN